MPAIAALTLADRTPANVVFTPQSIDALGVARYYDDNSIFDAKRVVSMSVTLPKNGSSVARIKEKIVIPIMDTVDTSKKLGEIIVNLDAVIPKLASANQRLDARAFIVSLAGNAVSTAAFTSLENVY